MRLFHALIDVCIALKRFMARSVSLYFRFQVIRFVLGSCCCCFLRLQGQMLDLG